MPHTARTSRHRSRPTGVDTRLTGKSSVSLRRPAARLQGLRCNGGTDSDVMVHAMELALADHADVLNMSIGAAFTNWPQ